jgi:hypothetical protein
VTADHVDDAGALVLHDAQGSEHHVTSFSELERL